MKSWIKRVLVIVGAVVIFGMIGIRIWLSTEGAVTSIVKKYETQLSEYAEKRVESDSKEKKSWFGWDIEAGRGEVPSVYFSVYYDGERDRGFYYTQSGEPLGFRGETEQLEMAESGPGWIWEQAKEEKSGNDKYYTEQIAGNWYWYEMQL